MFIFDSENNLINTNHIIKISAKSQIAYEKATFFISADLTHGTTVLHKCNSKHEHEKAFSDLCCKLGVN